MSRSRRAHSFHLAALMIGAAVACSDDGDLGSHGNPDPDAGAVPPGLDAGADAPLVKADAGADARPAPAGPVTIARVFANVTLRFPMMIAQIPGDKTRWFAAQRDGTIVSFPTVAPTGTPAEAADLATLAGPVYDTDEGGLLALAFHPKFAVNGRLYVSWTTVAESILGYLTSTDGGQTFTQYQTILSFPRGSEHHGGGLAFGKDGFLYASFGDGGHVERGQDPMGFDGKVLRIDVDTPPAIGATYVIPGGNPYKAGGGEPATFARGFRNPWRLSIDRSTGELWVGDVGRGMWEEIDRVHVGGNYGWPCREGAHTTDPPELDAVACAGAPTMSEPVVDLPRSDGWAVTGGVVYRGSLLPGFGGTYVFGDFGAAALFKVSFDAATKAAVRTRLAETDIPAGKWVSFGEDGDGEIYPVAYAAAGEIYKVVPAAGSAP
jgi:glucose/arabinose dehydrogenase